MEWHRYGKFRFMSGQNELFLTSHCEGNMWKARTVEHSNSAHIIILQLASSTYWHFYTGNLLLILDILCSSPFFSLTSMLHMQGANVIWSYIVCRDNALTILFMSIMWVDSIAIVCAFLHFSTLTSSYTSASAVHLDAEVRACVIKNYDSINFHCCLGDTWMAHWCMSPATGIVPWPNTFDENFYFMMYFP